MLPPPVIEDSDDECSDFSPLKSPAKVPAEEEAAVPDTVAHDASHVHRSGSTDPSFFQMVYEDQQRHHKTLVYQTSQGVEPISVNNQSVEHTPQTWNNSSITDLRCSEKRQKKDPKSFVDLTQVTTPGRASRESAADGLWDVPHSPALRLRGGGSLRRGNVRKTPQMSDLKAYGKRKRSNQSIASSELRNLTGSETADPLSLPAELSSPGARARKRTRRGTLESPSAQHTDAVHLLAMDSTPGRATRRTRHGMRSSPRSPQDADQAVIPRSEELIRATRNTAKEDGGQPSTVINETQFMDTEQKDKAKAKVANIEVTISKALSSSEQQTYKVFSPTAESCHHKDFGEPMPLPVLQPYAPNQKSSAASTVAVATPSAFASSLPKGEDSYLPSTEIPLPRSSTNTRSQRRTSDAVPTSSPDIIANSSASSRKKAKTTAKHADAWGPDEAAGLPQLPVPRSSRSSRLRSAVIDDLPDTEPPGGYEDPSHEMDQNKDCDDGAPAETISGRGRSTDPILIMSSDHEAEAAPTKSQKKRGRKKKETKKKEPKKRKEVVDSDADDLAEDEDFSPTKEVVVEDVDFVAEDDAPATTAVPDPQVSDETAQQIVSEGEKPKWRRGRPKKSDAKAGGTRGAHAAVTDSASTGSDGALGTVDTPLSEVGDVNARPSASSTSPSASSTRNSKTAPSDTGRGKENSIHHLEAEGADKALASTEHSSAAAVAKAEVSAEVPRINGNGNSGMGQQSKGQTGLAGKVLYRVGLSKRSRIAPLLKSLRK